MKYTRTSIPDLIICEPTVIGDDRGYFMETFRLDKFEDYIGESIHFCQENESKSSFGVLRGLHYQLPPFAQSKLVRVIQGSVLDVAVDIRKSSSTFGQHFAIELSESNRTQLFIPRGFAHGFVVLSDTAVFAYKVDNYYSPQHDRGLAYDDTSLGIDWKLKKEELKLSAKDLTHPTLSGIEAFT
jgi:dTDP-4-dehydrorhamnose 3,5-epimerase